MLAYGLVCMSMPENVTIRFPGLHITNVRAVVHMGIEVHSRDTWHVFPYDCTVRRVHYDEDIQ